MTEPQDRRLGELYRKASQETPPAHLDHAVMDMARKSVRRSLWSSLGGDWLAGAATVAVVVLSALVILTLPPASDRSESEVGLQAPSSDVPAMERKQRPAAGTAAPRQSAQDLAQPAAPTAPATASEFNDAMPEAARTIEKAESRVRKKQQPVPLDEAAGLASPAPAAAYYLWAGTFRERAQAQRLKTQVKGLGMDCDIEELHVGAADILYRVRVGPYRDLAGLKNARDKLAASGIEATIGAPPD
ncbi:MAG: SPOR domain-containing protein [Thiogranum sp.]|jgi:cell division protein FtsN